MTSKEADEAARAGLPVLYEGIEYKRITEAGYGYDGNGNRSPFVQLLDKNNNRSVIRVNPEKCTLKCE